MYRRDLFVRVRIDGICSLQDILKYTERAGLDAGPLRRAYQVMCVVPKETNDMMQFGRLQGYDVSDAV